MGKKSTKPRAVPARREKPAPAEPEKPAEGLSVNLEPAKEPTPEPAATFPPASEPAPKPATAKTVSAKEKKVIEKKAELPVARLELVSPEADGEASGESISNKLPIGVDYAPVSSQTSDSGSKPLSFIEAVKRGIIIFFKEITNKESFKYLGIAILVIALSLGFAFALGQASYGALVTNASNAGHLYGVLTSTIAFFFFARYLRQKKETVYVRRFLVVYFIVYFCMVMLILAFLQGNLVYFLSTLGNSFILFAVFTLIIFIISPEILGVLGSGGNIRKLFMSGQHVRLIVIYLFIAVMQVTGFSFLNYAIQLYSLGGPLAYSGVPGGGTGSWFDFFYFSMITFVTIGYGDMHPALPVSELACTIQALLSHVISILFIAVLLLYLGSSAPVATKDQKKV